MSARPTSRNVDRSSSPQSWLEGMASVQPVHDVERGELAGERVGARPAVGGEVHERAVLGSGRVRWRDALPRDAGAGGKVEAIDLKRHDLPFPNVDTSAVL